jgi:hypothetical protein
MEVQIESERDERAREMIQLAKSLAFLVVLGADRELSASFLFPQCLHVAPKMSPF